MGKNILLYDEDKQFSRLMSSVLEGRGHKVLKADPEDSSSILRHEDLDLIILAGPLKETDQITWLSNLRAQGNSAKVILVAQDSF